MTVMYTLASYMLVLICVLLTLFTSVGLYEVLTAAYDVVSGWVQDLKWKRRDGRRRKK